jgi:type III secretory pathway component EscS
MNNTQWIVLLIEVGLVAVAALVYLLRSLAQR